MDTYNNTDTDNALGELLNYAGEYLAREATGGVLITIFVVIFVVSAIKGLKAAGKKATLAAQEYARKQAEEARVLAQEHERLQTTESIQARRKKARAQSNLDAIAGGMNVPSVSLDNLTETEVPADSAISVSRESITDFAKKSMSRSLSETKAELYSTGRETAGNLFAGYMAESSSVPSAQMPSDGEVPKAEKPKNSNDLFGQYL